MIPDEEIRDLQAQADTRHTEANAAVDAFRDAPPGRDLKLWEPMSTALILADEVGQALRRALDTRKPADVTT